MFQLGGITYGPGFQSIKTLSYNEKEALSRIELPSELEERFSDYVLHPSLMDGALQTVMGLMVSTANDNTLYLPFSMGEVEIIKQIREVFG